MAATKARAQTEGPRRGKAFGPGEQSKYRVSYLGLTAGSAQITVGAELTQWGREVWPIVCTAKSESVIDLYPIKDKFVSYWDDRAQVPIGSDFFVDENKKRRRQRIRYEGTTATVTNKKEGDEEEETTVDVAEFSMDMAAVTFRVRNEALAVGAEYELPVFTGRKSFTLRAIVEDIETLSTPLGDKEVFRVRVVTDFSGKLAAKSDLRAFFTTDARHVPVRVEAEFLFGTVAGDLVAYEPGRDGESGG
jgi:hypothetical protein